MRLRNSLFRTAVDKFLNRAADAAARLRTEIGQLGKHATKEIQLTIARPDVDASFYRVARPLMDAHPEREAVI